MLTKRQGKILSSIVREYTNTAVPVSSSLIVKKYHPNYSSATIRNDMHKLEEEEYILKPHISAGRIPSDKGYRYFVDKLLRARRLSDKDQKRIQLELLKMKAQNVRLSRTLARLLSSATQCMAISGVPEKKEFYDFGMHTLMKQPEFDELDEFSRISASLDLIDEQIGAILEKVKENETKIFIGEENPIREINKCSMIVAPYRMDRGQTGLMAIVGPKRMKYGRNKNLIDFLKNIMSGKNFIILLILQNCTIAIFR